MKELKLRISILTFDYILFFVLIFVSNDTLIFGTNANRMFFYIHIIIMLAVLLFLLFYRRVIITSLTVFYITATFIVTTLITMCINLDFGANTIKYLYALFEIVLAFFIVSLVSRENFEKCFVQIMCFFAWFSIVLFVISLVAHPMIRFAPSISNENGIQYYWFGFGFLESLSPTSLPRMYGIFREPGVFAIFLLLALIMELFLKSHNERISLKRVLPLSIAAFLTFSTAAVILEFLLFLIYIISELPYGNNQNTKIVALFLFAVLIVFFLFFQESKVFRVIFGKLFVENNSTSSRFGSFVVNFQLFKENPLTGKGWTFVETNFPYYSVLSGYPKIHDTNTFLKYLAIYGVLPTVLTLIGCFRYFSVSKKYLVSIIITILYFALLSNEDLTVNIIFYLIALYGYQEKRNIANESFAN